MTVEDWQLDMRHKHAQGSPYADEPKTHATHAPGDKILFVMAYGLDYDVIESIEITEHIDLQAYAERFAEQVKDKWSHKLPDGTSFGQYLQKEKVAVVEKFETINIDPTNSGFSTEGFCALPHKDAA